MIIGGYQSPIKQGVSTRFRRFQRSFRKLFRYSDELHGGFLEDSVGFRGVSRRLRGFKEVSRLV